MVSTCNARSAGRTSVQSAAPLSSRLSLALIPAALFGAFRNKGFNPYSLLALPSPLYMQGETKERWFDLCAQAAITADSDRLLELTREIVHMLTEKERRLKKEPTNGRLLRTWS